MKTLLIFLIILYSYEIIYNSYQYGKVFYKKDRAIRRSYMNALAGWLCALVLAINLLVNYI